VAAVRARGLDRESGRDRHSRERRSTNVIARSHIRATTFGADVSITGVGRVVVLSRERTRVAHRAKAVYEVLYAMRADGSRVFFLRVFFFLIRRAVNRRLTEVSHAEREFNLHKRE